MSEKNLFFRHVVVSRIVGLVFLVLSVVTGCAYDTNEVNDLRLVSVDVITPEEMDERYSGRPKIWAKDLMVVRFVSRFDLPRMWRKGGIRYARVAPCPFFEGAGSETMEVYVAGSVDAINRETSTPQRYRREEDGLFEYTAVFPLTSYYWQQADGESMDTSVDRRQLFDLSRDPVDMCFALWSSDGKVWRGFVSNKVHVSRADIVAAIQRKRAGVEGD
ncbi:MAG: hypothetical protein ACK6DM_13795 [Alphaproteobacteria bacterium]